MILLITSSALSDTLHFSAKNFPKSNTISAFLRNSEQSLTYATDVNCLFISVGKPKKLKKPGNLTLLVTITSTLFDNHIQLGFYFYVSNACLSIKICLFFHNIF